MTDIKRSAIKVLIYGGGIGGLLLFGKVCEWYGSKKFSDWLVDMAKIGVMQKDLEDGHKVTLKYE